MTFLWIEFKFSSLEAFKFLLVSVFWNFTLMELTIQKGFFFFIFFLFWILELMSFPPRIFIFLGNILKIPLIIFFPLFSLSSNNISSVQFSSVTQSCLTLCDPMNRSTPGLPVHHQHPEFTQTHVHWVGDATQPSHPLLSPFPPAPNPSQNQSLFQWVNSSHEVAKVLEFQLQHHFFQWTPRTDFL